MKIIALLYDSVLDVGGVENHVLTLLQNRDPNRFSFIILSAVSKSFEEKVSRLNTPVIQLKRRHPLNPATPIFLSRLLRKNHVDLIHAHSPTAAIWGRMAGRLAGIPSVVTVHLPVEKYHGDLWTFRARFGRKLYQIVDRWFNRNSNFTRYLIYVSQRGFEKALMNGHSPKKRSMVIPIGINLEPFNLENRQKTRQHFGVLEDTKIIIFVGRLDRQKGVDLLLNAVSHLRSNEMQIKVWIVGDGPLLSTLEDQVDQMDLRDIIHFWGYQNDVAKFLLASDIFVLPSRYEAMPSSILEAMAAGLPCVVTEVGDNDLVVGDGIGGLVIPPEDINQLISAIHTLLSDSILCGQMAKAARERSKQYDEKIMVKQLEQVYNHCLV